MKGLFKKVDKSKITEDAKGHSVLTKTDNFYLCAIRRTDKDEELIGTVLLTEAQQNILNEATNPQGIQFTRK